MKTIPEFVNWWNHNVTGCDASYHHWATNHVGAAVTYSVYRQWFAPRDTQLRYSLSQLGKPLVLLALAKLGYESEDVDNRLKWIFNVGDFTEALLLTLMYCQGLEVHRCQEEVSWQGLGGHIDCFVDDTLVEVKTMSSSYWQSFVQVPNDDRGYLSQLCGYVQATDAKSYGFLCLNKATAELAWVTGFSLAQTLDTLQTKLVYLESINRVDDIAEVLIPPMPVRERKARKETGNWLIPDSMQYTKWRFDWYCSEDGVYCDYEKFCQKWRIQQ